MTLLNYQELIKELDKNEEDNHLLLANGFNYSLGVNTGYKDIYTQMCCENKEYKELSVFVENNYYDIELLIKKLTKTKSKSNNTKFLNRFIANKIKLDFMKACYSIVKNQIKNIYQEKNKGITILLKNFNNYFSLNYDPLLYLLLLQFKQKDDNRNVVAFQSNTLFKEIDLNAKHDNLYKIIKEARNSGSIVINANNSTKDLTLKTATKTYFQSTLTNKLKGKYLSKDIVAITTRIWNEEKISELKVNDGFLGNDFSSSPEQNLFFLHGAFHIYKNNNQFYKITQTEDQALYSRLEEVINNEEKDIVCIFEGRTEDKLSLINEDEYLKTCYNKLSSISGSLVIFGSSFAENDNHIFSQINSSNVSTIYISCGDVDEANKLDALCKKMFTNKNIYFFDYTSVSYK